MEWNNNCFNGPPPLAVTAAWAIVDSIADVTRVGSPASPRGRCTSQALVDEKTSFSTESHDQVVSESVPPNRTVQTCKEHLVDNAVYVFSADHTMLVTPSRLTPSRFSRIIFDSLEDFEREFDMTDFTSSSRWQGAVCCKHSESRVCGAMA